MTELDTTPELTMSEAKFALALAGPVAAAGRDRRADVGRVAGGGVRHQSARVRRDGDE